MRRETKFGLGVIGTLVVALGGVVGMRLAKAPVAAEAGEERGAREALAALESSRATPPVAEDKPALFSMNEAQFKETPSAATSAESPARATEPSPHHGHSRYSIEPATATTEPPPDDTPPTSFDPFHRAGQPGSPANANPATPAGEPAASSQPQATLSDGIAPGAPPLFEPPQIGTAPLAEPAPLASLPNEVPFAAGPNTMPGTLPLDPNAPTAVQTAGTADMQSGSRYADFRTHPSAGHQGATHLPSTNPPSTNPPPTHPHSGWDRYNPAPAQGNPGAPPMYNTELPHATIGGAAPGHRTPQYDVYGRDISNERDDPPPEAPSAAPMMPPATDLLGRRVDDIPPVEPHHHHQGETYTVVPNDNYWTIAEKVYGNGGYFKAIEEHNRERYPYSERLRTGDVVAVPSVKTLEQKYPDLCPKQRQAAPGRASGLLTSSRGGMPGARVYKVREGDTLFDIARSELGKASRWADIYELNRDQLGNDFDFLAPGMELVLPGSHVEHDPLTTQSHPLRTR